MTSTRIRIDCKILKWLNEQYGDKIEKEFKLKPTDNQLIEIGINHLRSYLELKTVNITKDEQCLRIKLED